MIESHQAGGLSLGRVQWGVFVLVAAAQVVGSLLGGAIGQVAGLRTAIAVGVVITLTSALPSIFSPLRTLRGVPKSQVEAPC